MIEISVIIPTYNRASQLRNCLDRLRRQTLPAGEFEVIVVVDGSTDGTREMLHGFVAPYSLRVIWQANAGQQVARNAGAAAAEGRYLLFLDDDILPAPELVAEHLCVQRRHGGVVGLGQIPFKLPADSHWFVRRIAGVWNAHYASLATGSTAPGWMDCFGGNLSVPRSEFLRIDGFEMGMRRSHDIELGYRLQQQGLPFVYIPDAVGWQDERKSFRVIARDAENHGAAWVELYRRHPATLPHLLGTFAGGASQRKLLLRRILLALHVPPALLAIVGSLSRSTAWREWWYTFLHRYCYWRGVRRAVDANTWRRLVSPTRILLYHAFGQPGEPPSRCVVPERRFRLQMVLLKWLRFRTLDLEEYLSYRREHRLPPARSVVITIDDGYADNRSVALPILRRYAFPATIFLVVDRTGRVNDWGNDPALLGRRLLSWQEVHEMQRAGIRIGAHTRTHPDLTSVSSEAARDEILSSREELERMIGCPVRLFAFPFGESDATIQAMAEQAGFWGSCGIRSGHNTLATPLHDLRRTEIFGTDNLGAFLLKLWSKRGTFWRLRRPALARYRLTSLLHSR